jgi:hypothetical protein
VTGLFVANVEATNEADARQRAAVLWCEAIENQNRLHGDEAVKAEFDFADGTESVEVEEE